MVHRSTPTACTRITNRTTITIRQKTRGSSCYKRPTGTWKPGHVLATRVGTTATRAGLTTKGIGTTSMKTNDTDEMKRLLLIVLTPTRDYTELCPHDTTLGA